MTIQQEIDPAMAPAAGPVGEVERIVARARQAQRDFEAGATQERYDMAALAAAWAIMEPGRNRALAERAVRDTGLGNVADKITKNHRKTLGLLRDIATARTCGIVSDDPATGITQIARPMGVIGAVVPSTNPAATPANNIINALKCGNAIVLSPSPKGAGSCELLLEYVHEEFSKLGISPDLVQMIPPPGAKAQTQRLMELADLLVVTGSQDNVRRAYTSGTPAVAVGAGNVSVIVDETADLTAAAQKIALSKTFDNATSCSSENGVIVVDAIFDAFLAALEQAGGAMVAADDRAAVISALWPDGHLNRHVIAQDADKTIAALGLTGKVRADASFLIIETDRIGPDEPLSGEKLSRVLTLYRASDYAQAVSIAGQIMAHQGAGHSVGIHTGDDSRALGLATQLPTCRVIVNQAHTFATGGSFNNGLPFSLSMGCGTWGGNSIDTNVHWRHFMQLSKVVREIPANEPSVDAMFSRYWEVAGK